MVPGAIAISSAKFRGVRTGSETVNATLRVSRGMSGKGGGWSRVGCGEQGG